MQAVVVFELRRYFTVPVRIATYVGQIALDIDVAGAEQLHEQVLQGVVVHATHGVDVEHVERAGLRVRSAQCDRRQREVGVLAHVVDHAAHHDHVEQVLALLPLGSPTDAQVPAVLQLRIDTAPGGAARDVLARRISRDQLRTYLRVECIFVYLDEIHPVRHLRTHTINPPIRDDSRSRVRPRSRDPRNTATRWCSVSGWISRMRIDPSVAAPPACSTMKAIGLASYIRRSLPGLPLVALSRGYMKMPPRVSTRWTSADHRGHPAHVEVGPRGPVLPARHLIDVTPDRRHPVAHVRHVDGEFRCLRRNASCAGRSARSRRLAIEGEGVDAVAEREHQHRARAVDRIAGRDLRVIRVAGRPPRADPVTPPGSAARRRSCRPKC